MPWKEFILRNYIGEKALVSASAFFTQGIPAASYSAAQRIRLNKNSDTTFLLSGWSMADSVPGIEKEGTNDTKKFWGLTLTFYYSNGDSETYSLPFAEYATDWQYAAMPVVPKQSGKTLNYADIKCCYYRNCNTARFDSISLTEEPCQTYKYDNEGNLTSVKSTGNGSETYGYGSITQNLMSMRTEGSGTYSYQYSTGRFGGQ